MTAEVAAVKRGAKLLDTVQPNWAKNINLDKLDLGSTEHCVLGQVHSDFQQGLQNIAEQAIARLVKALPREVRSVKLEHGPLDEQLVDQNSFELDGYHYGFNAASSQNGEFEALTKAWTREIVARQPVKKAARRARS